jgi:hypothetical protein
MEDILNTAFMQTVNDDTNLDSATNKTRADVVDEVALSASPELKRTDSTTITIKRARANEEWEGNDDDFVVSTPVTTCKPNVEPVAPKKKRQVLLNVIVLFCMSVHYVAS